MSPLRKVLDDARSGCNRADFTVLSAHTDPYRLDTRTNHTTARWFAEQMARLQLLNRKLHLRGIHYAMLGSTALPTGEAAYANTGENWLFMQDAASRARWLGYIPFDAISDARNAAPVIRLHERKPVETWVQMDPDIILPSIDDLDPRISITGFEGRQPYRLAFYGEKTSLEPILAPIANTYGIDLFLPTGEISDTQMHLMASTAAADGRELIVFVLADFDPAGHQMAVSIGRKLQALRDLLFPSLKFRLYPTALTETQVREFDLPSTPLKETEKRGDRWRAAHGGLEQTEIDALATLQPELLRKIVTDAIKPFNDQMLSSRVFEARGEWRDQAQKALEEQIDGTGLQALREQAEEQIESIRQQLRKIEAQARIASGDLAIDLPEPVIPEPEIDEALQPSWTWAEQTRALIARKRYASGAEDRS